MEIVHPFKGEVQRFYDRAKTQLPSTITEESAQQAWIARRTIEISEGSVSQTRALQAMLLSWVHQEGIWLDHPDKPDSFRDFLKSIGSEQEGNRLSPSTISDFAAVAEIIAPYCGHADIPIRQTLTGKTWGKFREAIPVMRRAIETEDDPAPVIENVLADVKALPTRDAVREKYREQRAEKIGVGDSVEADGQMHVHLVIDPDEWPRLKNLLSRRVDWKVLMLASTRQIRIPLEG